MTSVTDIERICYTKVGKIIRKKIEHGIWDVKNGPAQKIDGKLRWVLRITLDVHQEDKIRMVYREIIKYEPKTN